MKSFAAITTSVLSLAVSVAALCGTKAPIGPVTLYANTKDYHFELIKYYKLVATEGRFLLGNNATTYSCPAFSNSPNQCPDDPDLEPYVAPGFVSRRPAFNIQDGGMSMAVGAPGGQKVYMEADGALAFLPANQTALPAGGVDIDFEFLMDGLANGPMLLVGGWDNFVACPTVNSSDLGFPFHVYVVTSATNNDGQLSHCTPFVMVVSPEVDGSNATTFNVTKSFSVPYEYV